MNDKELLGFAAKAAGISIRLFSSNGNAVIDQGSGGPESCLVTIWNPLLDDGQALRLAVSLGLNVIQQHTLRSHEPVSAACGFGVDDDYRVTSTKYDGNRMDATRIAIVRAAAEIGRGMA